MMVLLDDRYITVVAVIAAVPQEGAEPESWLQARRA
jgi:hypothetical protein